MDAGSGTAAIVKLSKTPMYDPSALKACILHFECIALDKELRIAIHQATHDRLRTPSTPGEL